MRGGCKLQPGHLNTREERRQLRLLAHDLQAQLDRTSNPERVAELQAQLDSVKREQAYDRQASPRGKRQNGRAK